MKKRTVLLAFILLAMMLVAVVPALAGTTTISGTLTDAQSLAQDNDDDANTCSSLTNGVDSWYYTLRQFQVTESGDYTYEDTGFLSGDPTAIDMWITFYTGDVSGFNTADPRTNGCFANFDDAGTVSLTAGVSYLLKVSTVTAGVTGPYVFSLAGPGDVVAVNTANPMLSDGRINGQQAAPVILYCDGTTVNGFSVNGAPLFSVENGGTASGAWGSVGTAPDGRMLVSSAFPDGKAYYFAFDGCPNGKYDAFSGTPPQVFDSGSY